MRELTVDVIVKTPTFTAALLSVSVTVNGIPSSGGSSSSSTADEGITAFATGGQASATACTRSYNFIDTCATDGDSVKARAAVKNTSQVFQNNTAKVVYLYPQTGEYFIGKSVDEYIELDPYSIKTIVCATNGKYRYF